jgi:hypothetical protein
MTITINKGTVIALVVGLILGIGTGWVLFEKKLTSQQPIELHHKVSIEK